MPLRKCIREHTHREYLTWQAYLDEQWNEPSRTDYYLMQVAQEVRRVLAKHPEKILLNVFKIPFKSSAPPAAETVKQKTSNSKSFWLGLVGKWRSGDGG